MFPNGKESYLVNSTFFFLEEKPLVGWVAKGGYGLEQGNVEDLMLGKDFLFSGFNK